MPYIYFNFLGQLLEVVSICSSYVNSGTTKVGGIGPFGVSTFWRYDSEGQKVSLISTSSTGTLINLYTYMYDFAGNCTLSNDLGGYDYYQYDRKDRLTTVVGSCPSTGYGVLYRYDVNDNVTYNTEPATIYGVTFTYDLANRITTSYYYGKVSTYGYDPNGNLLSIQETDMATSNTYDAENRLWTVLQGNPATLIASYLYDGDGMKAASWDSGTGQTTLIWDGSTNLQADVTPLDLGAVFISQTVPVAMVVGQQQPVSITFCNTGPVSWGAALFFGISFAAPLGSSLWGGYTMDIHNTHDFAGPGQSWTASFTVTAPTTPGFYPWMWQMRWGASATTFGELSPMMYIQVG